MTSIQIAGIIVGMILTCMIVVVLAVGYALRETHTYIGVLEKRTLDAERAAENAKADADDWKRQYRIALSNRSEP